MPKTPVAQQMRNLPFFNAVLIFSLLLVIAYSTSQVIAIEQKLLEQQYRYSLINLGLGIDARIGSMKLIAKTIANDEHIHHWVENGFAADQETLLVDKLGFLVTEYGLTSASFADKATNKYWNHEGFLRVLKPEIDKWYFPYLASGHQDLISVYHDKNKNRVDVYVNYQQTNGSGLSGIATSFDGVVDMLKDSIFAEQGEIYLVDGDGVVQVRAKSSEEEVKNLKDVFPEDVVSHLLQPKLSNTLEFIEYNNGLLGARYMPNMNWYVVVHVGK